ncbi:transcription antitermination factor NusB [Marinoscillum sp. MHG1-6]|uniref:transcription antitermination factor NusB n=1 Tax=Marinoscillum sp. MHG1-6 TaxID=2959627 RepID=UPI0021588945|nr:transcription antitermination factor NusB [Marinoscillum sp. MHG1-6]
MLNRRILRVKAMQALYSYFLAQESLKNVVNEELESHYYPDPAKDDFTDADQFTARRKTASRLYFEFLDVKKVEASESVDSEITENVQAHINRYYTFLTQEVKTIEQQMLKDVDDLEGMYLKLIQLALEFTHIENQEKGKKERAYIQKASDWKYHFINNPVIDSLTKFESFNKALIDQKISWQDEYDTIKSWYKDILQKDEYLIEYQKKDNPTPEEHQEAVVYLFKKIIFKNEVIGDYLTSVDLRWVENHPILRSMVVKTFQDYLPELEEPFELKQVSRNEEEDIEFFKKLFSQAVKREKELDKIIADHTRNWDISRVALTDRIILRMALTEMITFHSIPVKVTINEFIEISKNYSTPKSKQFINGILDVLANELTSEGVIRKSGRGLIDNK